MVDKICDSLVERMRKEMPDINEEKAEIIKFGLQNIVGEIPKFFIMMLIAWLLGVFELSIITFLIILPYRAFSGGFHLKTHLGCIIGTSLMYSGTALLAKNILIETMYLRYVLLIGIWIFGMLMIKLYAPADTENVPILRKKDRRKKQLCSYITLTVTLIIGNFIKNDVIFNIIILGMLFQTLTITKLAYKLTKNKYGFEVYT
ncbi:MAG: accessory gene regulator B family protein [Clostridia bacterium]|nr:accessory gene regulator B family protein [Clostridia bacterium]